MTATGTLCLRNRSYVPRAPRGKATVHDMSTDGCLLGAYRGAWCLIGSGRGLNIFEGRSKVERRSFDGASMVVCLARIAEHGASSVPAGV